jgi:hypothetical protein
MIYCNFLFFQKKTVLGLARDRESAQDIQYGADGRWVGGTTSDGEWLSFLLGGDKLEYQ